MRPQISDLHPIRERKGNETGIDGIGCFAYEQGYLACLCRALRAVSHDGPLGEFEQLLQPKAAPGL
jgi:hypothetical protein